METVSISGKQGRPLVVDLHSHILTPAAEKLVAGTPGKRAEQEAQKRQQGSASSEYNAKVQGPAIAQKLIDVETRLKDMDAMGVDIQVLSPAPGQFHYWAEPDMARENVRLINENIAAHCEKYPSRFLGLGEVAMQHATLAVEQLEYAVKKLGFRGVEICTSIEGQDLDDAKFHSFWAKVEELGCVVFLHPQSCPPLADRLNRSYLSNIIGNPLDTTIALSHLIFGGTLDRYPGVKIVAPHGGGFLPTYISRSDHAYAARSDVKTMKRKPSEYLKQIYFDTIVYTPEAVRALVEQVGAGQVVVGTDYPYDMGHYDPRELVSAIKALSPAEGEAILGRNAMKLLGLRASV